MLNAGLSPEHEERDSAALFDGIGLTAPKIPFMLQSGFPSEEQVAQYPGHAAEWQQQTGDPAYHGHRRG